MNIEENTRTTEQQRNLVDKKLCLTCSSKKTAIQCSKCIEPSCKKCSFFIDEEEFFHLELLPDEIQGKTFCTACYHETVYGVLENSRELLERAKNVDVYGKEQGSETGLIKRIEKPIVIKDADDKEETLLRMAFYAVQKGYDTLVDVKIESKKTGVGTYKKLIWDGYAVPVDPKIKK